MDSARRMHTLMTHPQLVARPVYTRDNFTWLTFFLLGYFAYMQAALGPVMPFLREELDLSYTVAGLHITLLAAGMIVSGLSGLAVVRRFGRKAVFWGGSGGMALGGLLLVLGQTPVLTVAGALVMGVFGTFMLNLIPATLSDQHGPNRATAVTESNVVASAATVLPPILIGLFAGTPITWRGVYWAAMLAWIGAALLGRRVTVPAPVNSGVDADGRALPLPRQFWLVFAVLVLVVSAEWSVVAWSADFLAGPVGLDTALASSLMSAYFLAMVIGRLVGSRLTRRLSSETLLPGALGLALAGFLLQWLAPVAPLNVIGLFICGLGVANLFPMSLAWATVIAGDQTDRAGALVSLAAGLAILSAPQVLGAAADLVGIGQAMGLIVVILLVALGAVMLARRG
ncbi:MAG: MFS transporter [Anaerolineae bacterium]|nr:MFS transporter [Anaerolineae bacterium]